MMRFTKRRFAVLILAFAAAACAQPGWDPSAKQQAMETIAAFKEANPNLNSFFNEAQGYAVFPTVGKGAIGLGAGYGEGTVFEKGVAIGLSSVTKLDLGLQLGGQTYRQIVFFKDQAGHIYHTYSAFARGLDIFIGAYNLLDIVPKGRDEAKLPFSMEWVRYHDRYDDG